ncbi:MAG TPA: FAD-dependent oxidoreductase [Gemmatimonadaceae bacterium]|nr:FAD-dependent oxidoreductase [Gemmatimonadaceae bacterium]
MKEHSSRPYAIVVGAGILGAACAEALAREDWRVLVLEGGSIGGGATASAMGHLVAMDDRPAQLALTAYSLRLWRDIAPRLPDDVQLLPCGTLWLAEDDAQLGMVREKQRALADAGVEAEEVDASALARLEPSLRSSLAGALRVPGDSVLHPRSAAQWLMGQACSRGAEVREGVAVTTLAAHAVSTSEGVLEADVVIVAAGARAADLIHDLPIVPRKGHILVTERQPALCRHQLVELGYLRSAHAFTESSVAFNVQPRASGQLLIGSSRQLAGWDASPDVEIVRQMTERAVYFVPRLAGMSGFRLWTGFRPATPDGLPLIGTWPAIDGVWIAGGHEGLGITSSLATAQLIADQLAGRTPAIDPAPYAAARASSLAIDTGART